MARDKALAEVERLLANSGTALKTSARDLVSQWEGVTFSYNQLASRVEAVLALIDARWQVPAEAIVGQIKRLLNGEIATVDPAGMGWERCRHGEWMPPGVPCVGPPSAEELRGFVECWPSEVPQDSPDSVPPGVEALRARGYERINRARPEVEESVRRGNPEHEGFRACFPDSCGNDECRVCGDSDMYEREEDKRGRKIDGA